MPSRLKAALQYTLIISITIVLIWVSLRGLTINDSGTETYQDKWAYLKATWVKADKGWLAVMAVVAMISHVVRAERWRMLLVPYGLNPSLGSSFLSLMVGYLVNLVVPRGGEVSRTINLYKLSKVPVDLSFGTVVVERIVDLICLIVLFCAAFFLESQKLISFLDTLSFDYASGKSKLLWLLVLSAAGLVCMIIFYWMVKRNTKIKNFIVKTWLGFKSGLLSVFKLQKKGLFIFYSVVIWLLYFLMSYAVIQAFPSTSELGFSAVLSLFTIGAIAMAAPLPGGTGSYHALVPAGLVFLYAIDQADAVAFTFIFHGWQTVIVIVAGALSFIITTALVRRQAKENISEGERT